MQASKWSFALRLEYSADGYVRLTFAQFCALTFSKRQTIEDEDLRQELLDQDLPVLSAGYCNWLDESTPVQVSVGWAWFCTASNAPQLLAPGGINSNVMFTSLGGNDLGTALTDGLLKAWLSARNWQAPPTFLSQTETNRDKAWVH
jgi:hypothetical protein